MRHTSIALLLVACAASSTPARPPEPDGAVHCPGYCDAVRRCAEEFHYAACAEDCVRLLTSPKEAEVSGITAEVVSCWAKAASCELAVACDAAEGD